MTRILATMVALGLACGGGTTSPGNPIDGGAGGSGGSDGGMIAGGAGGGAAGGIIAGGGGSGGFSGGIIADAAGGGRGGAGGADDVRNDVRIPWENLELHQGYGPCPTDSCSSSWVVTPDGHMATTRMGDAGAAQMTPTDLTELDGIVSSTAFVDGMAKGFTCDRPPTDISVNLRWSRNCLPQQQDVTGCTTTGPNGNLPRRVSNLLMKY